MASSCDAGRSTVLVTLAQTTSSQGQTLPYQTTSSSFSRLSAAVVLDPARYSFLSTALSRPDFWGVQNVHEASSRYYLSTLLTHYPNSVKEVLIVIYGCIDPLGMVAPSS